MLPNQNTLGVVLEPVDVPTVMDAFNTARTYEGGPDPLKGKATLQLPPADKDGLIPVDEFTAMEIETYAVMGLRVITREIKAADIEFETRFMTLIPANMQRAAELEEKLHTLEAHAMTLQGLQRAVGDNLLLSEQSQISAGS